MAGQMSFEHKALVAELREPLGGSTWTGTDGIMAKAAAAIESLSAQSAQPQAGEAVAFQWRTIDGWVESNILGGAAARQSYARQMADQIGLGYRELYASPQPANPAQVTDVTVEIGARVHDHWSGDGTVGAMNARRNTLEILTAAIGAGGLAVAVKPLEWDRDEGQPGADLIAEPDPYHLYRIRHLNHGEFDVILNTDTGSIWFRQKGETHPNYASAKAAAQADYEYHIRSGLSQPDHRRDGVGHGMSSLLFSHYAPADERVVEALEALRIDRDNEAERKVRARRDKDATMVAVHAYAEGVLAGHVKSFDAALAQEGRKDG